MSLTVSKIRGVMRWRRIVWLFLLQAAIWPVRAERSANWKMFKVTDGLAESYSAAVTVSPRGNVWVKHRDVDEISVLNGYGIDTLPSPGPENYRVYESRASQFWSLFSQGLLVYSGSQWIRRPVAEIQAEIRADPRRRVHEIPLIPAERDHLLFLLPDKLMEYDLSTRKTSLIKHVSQTGLGRFLEMSESRQGGLWISGAKGLGRMTGQVRHLRTGAPWQEYLLDESLHLDNLQRPFEDDQGGITTVASDLNSNSKRVLLHFNGTNWTVRQIEAATLRQAWPGWDQTTWTFTFDSLFRLDPLPLTGAYREKVWAGRYMDVAVETNGTFWVASSEGLFRYAPNLWRTPAKADDINSHIHAILEDAQGRLWFASGEALICRDGEDWKSFPMPAGIEGTLESRDTLFALPGDELLLTFGEKVFRFLPQTERFENVQHPSGHPVKVLGQLPDRTVAVQLISNARAEGGEFELERFDGHRFHPWLQSPTQWSFGSEVYVTLAQANGDLWFGGMGGVARYRNGSWELFGPAQGFRGAKALCMAEAGGGRIWCASADRVFEYNGKSWALVRSGFDRIAKIARARDEKVWIATAQGLFIYSYATGTWMSHGVEEGLPSPGVSEIALDRSGQLWAGTTRGLSLFHPDADTAPPKALVPLLENANGTTTGEKAVFLLNGVDRWQNTPTDRLLFSTKLDEGQWSPYTNSAVKAFEQLGAGQHRLEVRAMDRNWNDDHDREPAFLEFSVVVAWYKDPRLLVIVLSGAILVIFFAGLAVNRHLQLIRSYAEVERIVGLRTRELERANEELVQSQKMKALGTLAAGIAHDFNNILSIIKGSAQIIQSNLEDKQKVLTRLSRIQSVVEQGSGIVKSILGLSQVRQKDVTLTNLNQVAEDTVKLVGDRFLHEVTVEFKPSGPMPEMLLAKELIQQMLLNLILNAADAMERRGQVLLKTGELQYLPRNLALSPARAARYFFVAVQDTGCGIAPEILPRVFEPFFTTKALSTRRGTGLGLSIVYELARELGCGIEVNSVVGKGSTFTLILPLKSEAASESSV